LAFPAVGGTCATWLAQNSQSPPKSALEMALPGEFSTPYHHAEVPWKCKININE
jgi:hypothetical protein